MAPGDARTLAIEHSEFEDPAKGIVNETWRANGWVIRLMTSANNAGQWCFQIYVPHHDVGPWMGRETECEVDHPEAVALIARLCDELAIVPAERSLGDFRFGSRADWQRVAEALRVALTTTPT